MDIEGYIKRQRDISGEGENLEYTLLLINNINIELCILH